MQIKPLRSMVGSYGRIRRGVLIDVPDRIARDLIRRGKAVGMGTGAEAGPAAANPSSGQGGPSGGPAGKATTSSSSPADQALSLIHI